MALPKFSKIGPSVPFCPTGLIAPLAAATPTNAAPPTSGERARAEPGGPSPPKVETGRRPVSGTAWRVDEEAFA